ncbi:MAG: hypothetical protein A6F70_02605 [Cycloclasticus sp. symbiont of Bathymodiolus heckerae]|nr:MAG: hypothetical protein A6F70_02605 [Cycloclasticus sp. symbiont of Bathymodiolus heckerae]
MTKPLPTFLGEVIHYAANNHLKKQPKNHLQSFKLNDLNSACFDENIAKTLIGYGFLCTSLKILFSPKLSCCVATN